MLSVSRTTVRQGIAILVTSGYVSVRRGQGGGIFVESTWRSDAPTIIRRTLQPDWARLEHLFDYRSVVEAEIAKVAARRRTEKNIDALRAALDDYISSPARASPLSDGRPATSPDDCGRNRQPVLCRTELDDSSRRRPRHGGRAMEPRPTRSRASRTSRTYPSHHRR